MLRPLESQGTFEEDHLKRCCTCTNVSIQGLNTFTISQLWWIQGLHPSPQPLGQTWQQQVSETTLFLTSLIAIYTYKHIISSISGVARHQAKVFQSFTLLASGKLIRKRAQEETAHSTHQQRYCAYMPQFGEGFLIKSEIRQHSLRVAPLDLGVALLKGGFLIMNFLNRYNF